MRRLSRKPHRNLRFQPLEDRRLLTGGVSEAFVAKVYQDLLGRTADSGANTYWTSFLNQGGGRGQFVQAIVGSPEYAGDQVQNVFRQLLNRPADSGGVSYFASLLASGGTTEQVDATIAGSQEYFQNRGGGTNQGFVDALFRDALDRPADSGAVAFFQQQLTAGTTRQQLASEIFTSAEHDQIVVQEAYAQLLQRQPDTTELNAGVATLERGAGDQQVAASIVSTDEYFNLYPFYITQVYHDLLARPADAPSLTNWTNFLDSSGSRQQMSQAFVSSPEYRQLQVQNIFRALLGRAADADATAYFASVLQSGGTVEQVDATLAGSDEYFHSRGGDSNTGFLTALYHDALGRPIDPQGEAYWNQSLASGVGRGQIALTLFTSAEHRQLLVGELVEQFLRRPANADDQATYGGILATGRDEDVVASLISSPEYFAGGWLTIDSLSAGSAAPGSLLTITGGGFDPTAPLAVRFFDQAGYDVTVPVVNQQATTATVVVPPYLDPATGTSASGTVQVELVKPFGGQTVTSPSLGGFEIGAMPSPAAAPGATLRNFAQSASQYATQLANQASAANFGPSYASDLNALASSLQTLAGSIQTVVDNPTQSFTLGTVGGSTVTVTGADLHATEQFLLAMLEGEAAGESAGGTPTGQAQLRAAGAAGGSSSQGDPALDNMIAQMQNNPDGSAVPWSQYWSTRIGTAFTQGLSVIGGSLAAAAGLVTGAFGGEAAASGTGQAIAALFYSTFGSALAVAGAGAAQAASAGTSALNQIKQGIQQIEKQIEGSNIGGKLGNILSGASGTLSQLWHDATMTVPNHFTADAWLNLTSIPLTIQFPPMVAHGQLPAAQSLEIASEPYSTAPLTFDVSDTALTGGLGWFDVTPTHGSLAPGQSTNLSVSLNLFAEFLNPGHYHDEITITNRTNPGDEVTVGVSIDVLGSSLIGTWGGTWSGQNYGATGGANGPSQSVSGNWSLAITSVDTTDDTFDGSFNWNGNDGYWLPIYDANGNVIGFKATADPVNVTLPLTDWPYQLQSDGVTYYVANPYNQNGPGGGAQGYGPFFYLLLNTATDEVVPGTGPNAAGSQFTTNPTTPDGSSTDFTQGGMSGQKTASD